MKRSTESSLYLCVSNIQEMRKLHKDAFLKKHNIKLGFMSAFVKAAAYALTDQPAVNAGVITHTIYHDAPKKKTPLCFHKTSLPKCFDPAVIDDTTKEIVYRDYVDISVAVATPKVPTFDLLRLPVVAV